MFGRRRREDFLGQIEALNQRGGRALSLVDLLRAGTLTPEMAGFCGCALLGGASLLTGARAGGAGKTTLMAALLGFLPEGERLVTVGAEAAPAPQALPERGPVCLLAHELGRGAYYGYLWGESAACYLGWPARGLRVASNLHADTLAETRGVLTSTEVGLSGDAFQRIELVLFITASWGNRGTIHRVTTLHYSPDRGPHRLLWQWNPEKDRFDWEGEGKPEDHLPDETANAFSALVQGCRELAESGPTDYAQVRVALLNLEADILHAP